VTDAAPHTDTPARARLAAALLAWGQPRPRFPAPLAAELLAPLTVAAVGLPPERRITLSAGRLREVPDTPFVHDRANVRGALAQAAVERDLLAAHRGSPAAVITAVWEDAASRRPGDPRSRSWWLNHLAPASAQDLRTELVELVQGFREVWPTLPADRVVVQPSRTVGIELVAGRVELRGRIGPRIDSVRTDDRARVLLLDLRTSRPHPEQDRRRLRELALLETLASGRPPFRWATLHLTDLRAEVEDLAPDTLRATAAALATELEAAGMSQGGATITP
jgi:ribosomal protein L30/L7E